MGQKVNPHGLRVGVISDWDSNWFAEGKFADYLVEDYKIREFVKKKLYSAGISKIEIERPTDKVRVIIHTAKPGFVIGKGGAEIENLKKELLKVLDRKVALDIKIMDIKNPDSHAQLVAENIAQQLENRKPFWLILPAVSSPLPEIATELPSLHPAIQNASNNDNKSIFIFLIFVLLLQTYVCILSYRILKQRSIAFCPLPIIPCHILFSYPLCFY